MHKPHLQVDTLSGLLPTRGNVIPQTHKEKLPQELLFDQLVMVLMDYLAHDATLTYQVCISFNKCGPKSEDSLALSGESHS